MNRVFRSAIFYLVLIIAVVWVFNLYRSTSGQPEELDVTKFNQALGAGEIASVKFLNKDEKVVGELEGGQEFEVFLPKDTIDDFWEDAKDQTGLLVSADPQTGSVWLSVLFQFLPILLLSASSAAAKPPSSVRSSASMKSSVARATVAWRSWPVARYASR